MASGSTDFRSGLLAGLAYLLLYPRYLFPVILFVALTTASALQAVAQEEAFPPIVVEPTNIYGAYKVGFENLQVSSVTYIEDLGAALLSGPGYVVALDLASMQALWTRSLIGDGIVMSGDSFPSPQKIVVGSTSGEVIIVDPRASTNIIEYFTSSGLEVTDVALGQSGNSLVAAALDSEGNLYLFRVPQKYWAVIGPNVGDEALSGISGARISWFRPVVELAGWSSYIVNSSKLLVNPTEYPEGIFANLTLSFYYNRSGFLQPAVPGTEEDDIYRTVKTLVYALVLPRANAAYFLDTVEEANTSSFFLAGIHASSYVVHAFFEVKVIDRFTGNIVDEACYYANKTLSLSPGSESEALLVLQPLAGNLEECYSITGIDPRTINRASLDTLFLVDTSGVPESLDLGSSVVLVQVPFPVEPDIGVAGIDDPPLALLLKPSSTPTGWPRDATYMLVIGVGRALLVYLLDSSFNILDFPEKTEYGVLEAIILESNPTSVAVAPDASRVYVGTSNGRLVELTWVYDRGSGTARYIASRSLQVSTADVSSLSLLPGGSLLLATAADGSIQLVDLDSWRPLWRGIKDFPSIQLNLASLEIAFADSSKAIYFSGEGFMIVFYHNLRTYVPLEVNVEPIVKSLEGDTYKIETPEGSKALIIGPEGDARAQAIIGQEVLFVPEGAHRLLVELPGLGSAEYPSVTVSFPSTTYTASIMLRELEVYAFTPLESDVESGKYANMLLAGPRPGANVSLTPAGQSQALPYSASPLPISSITGDNGTARFVAWDGVAYDVSVRLLHFKKGEASIDYFDSARVEVELQPVVYTTTISVVDSEAAAAGIVYYVKGSILTITLLDNGRSVNVTLPEGLITLKLPWGLFLLRVSSENYEDSSLTVFIDRQVDITIEAPPKRYAVILKVNLNDPIAGLANGPLSNAIVKLALADPPIGWNTTLTLDENGEVTLLLRYGIYALYLDHWVTGNASKPFIVDRDGDYLLAFRPRYSNVSFIIEDSEIKGLLPSGAVLSLTYLGGPWSSSTTKTLEEAINGILLPFGDYRIDVTAPRYYPETIYASIDSGQETISETIDPVKVSVTFKVEINDPVTGIASGPVEGAIIRAVIIEPEIPLEEIVLITGSNGEATTVMRLGSYNITIEHGYLKPKLLVASVTEVTRSIDIRLEPFYINASFLVLDAETRNPIPGATVFVERVYPGTQKTLSTSLGNSSTKTMLLPAGVYRLTIVIPERYKPLTLEADMPPSTETRIVAGLEPQRTFVNVIASIREAFINYEGEQIALPETPLRRAKIVLEPSDPVLIAAGAPAIVSFTDENGVASIGSIRSGTYTVRVDFPGFEPSEVVAGVTGPSATILLAARPLTNPVTFMVLDKELEAGSQVLDKATLSIVRFNGAKTGIVLEYTPGSQILLPTGSYVVLASREGYREARINTTVFGPLDIEVELEPIRLNVSIQVNALVSGSTGSVLWGELVLRYLDLPLKEPVIRVEIVEGRASASLRPGTYTITYIEESLNITSQATLLRVSPGETLYMVEVTVDPKVLELEILDSEFKTPIDQALVLISYNGPLGLLTARETAIDGRARLELPPGIYTVITSANGYEEAVTRFNLTGSTTISILQPPVMVGAAINFVDIDGSIVSLSGIKVKLAHRELPLTLEFTSKEGIVEADRLRLGVYYVEVTPPADSVYAQAFTVLEVTEKGFNQTTITLPFKEYNVSIILLESDTKEKAKGLYRIEFARREPGSAELGFPRSVLVEGETEILLPPGTYEASLTLVEGSEIYKIPRKAVFSVKGPLNVTLNLEPRIFDASVIVVDDRGEPAANALVQIIGPRGFPIAAGYTDSQGVFKYKAKYGTYTVTVKKQGFEETSIAITLPESGVTTIALDPTLMTIIKRYLPLIVGAAGLVIIGAILYSVRGRIAEKILEEEYF